MTTLTIISVFAYVLFFCAMIYGIRYYIEFVRFKNAKNDIAITNAKIMALKMALRVRVKNKLSSFREHFATVITNGDEIDKSLNEIFAIKYEAGSDFQKFFDLSKQIILNMKNDHRYVSAFAEINAKQNTTSENGTIAQKLQEFSGPDYKNEIALVRIIKEIADTHNKLSKKITAFNEAYKHKNKFRPLQEINVIQFNFLSDINTLLKDSDVLLNEIQQSKSDSVVRAA